VAYVQLKEVTWRENGPVSLEIGRGELLSIIGAADAGTTQLLKIIAGLSAASAGEVLIAGEKVQSPQTAIGFVPRSPALLPWRTVSRNVLLQAELRGLDMDDAEIRARVLLACAGLSGYEDARPRQLPLNALPWVAVCRALIHEPSLLLLDDPFAQMDSLAREAAGTIFQRLWNTSRPAVVLATQCIAEAVLLSDRIAVMSPRPERIAQMIPIELPRPRRVDKATTPKLTEYANRIRTLLQAQGVLP
jgi:NitT/TauT family transport system ATP-binding protein